jgi:hypothetical protein
MNMVNALPTNRVVTLGTGTDVAYMRISSTTSQTVAALNGNAQSFIYNITLNTASTLTINGADNGSFAGTIGTNGNGSFAQAGINIVKNGSGTQALTGNIVNNGGTTSTVTVQQHLRWRDSDFRGHIRRRRNWSARKRHDRHSQHHCKYRRNTSSFKYRRNGSGTERRANHSWRW